jgi:hypothetical protein
VCAVIRIPTIAITSMTSEMPTAMATSVQVLPELEVKTARTDGPRTSTPATAPMM